MIVIDGEVALILASSLCLGSAVRRGVLAEAYDAKLWSHVLSLNYRLFTFLERRGLLFPVSLAAHIEHNLLCCKFLQGSLHLLNVRPAVVLLFAGRLRPQFVLVGGAQPIQTMLEVGNALAVEEGFGRGSLIVPRIMHLIYHINRECLVLLMLHRCLLLLRVAFLFVTISECLVAGFATD